VGKADDAAVWPIAASYIGRRDFVEVPAVKRDRSKDAPKSAAELMAELNADPDYVARMGKRDRQRAENVNNYRRAAEPILAELAASGFKLQSLGDLRHSGAEYPAAIPILVRWLPKVENAQVKEDLVRSLSVPWSVPEAVPALISEFQRSDDLQWDGLRWAIANGLAVTADDAVFDQLVALVTDKKYGKEREMLALALGNCRDPRAVEVLIKLLADEQVVGHAVMALGKLKSKAARSQIQALLKHPTDWVRAEASKALAAIDGLPAAVQ
jgi:HEAT repeat protein